jgi:hypothetical protein
MRLVLVALGAVVCAACGSSTAPTPKLVLTVSGPATVQGHDTTLNGQPVHLCLYALTATASGGKPGDVATWSGGHFTLTLTRTGRQSSQTISAADAYFDDNPEVAAGTEASGGGYAYWSGPFSLRNTFYYSTPQTTTDSATYAMSCL